MKGRTVAGLAGLLLAASAMGAPGEQQRRADWQMTCAQHPISTSFEIDSGGRAWFGAADTLYILDAASGIILRTQDMGKSPLPPSSRMDQSSIRSITHYNIDDDREDETFVALGNGNIHVYDQVMLNRTYLLEDMVSGGIAVGTFPDGHPGIVVPGLHGKICALDARLGKERWQYDAQDLLYGTPIFSKRGDIIAATDNGTLLCLRGEDGSLLWKNTYASGISAGSLRFNASPYLDGDRVLITGFDRTTKCFDVTSGALEAVLPQQQVSIFPKMQALLQKYRDTFVDKAKELYAAGDAIVKVGKKDDFLFYGTQQGRVGRMQLTGP